MSAQVTTGARQQAHPHIHNGGPSTQGVPARTTTVTSFQTPYFSSWDQYYAYYYGRSQYPRPMDQAQYAQAGPPVRPEANQAQPSRKSDFAKELTTALKNLPTGLQKGIDPTLTGVDILRNMHDVDWDRLMMNIDWSQYKGDALPRALGEFFHVRELWMQDKGATGRTKRQP
ncbi:hypothetical protein NLI96_g3085 [Meripilus lineatus]|uniref:Uncharacterized protein n=1 Tax=Meripilus lineatus TaxID=2056292 RepID=A0AAD5YJD5_9APHY|nr:hypothetical protein NLI96_g3085 [Physisporinus lineatus]